MDRNSKDYFENLVSGHKSSLPPDEKFVGADEEIFENAPEAVVAKVEKIAISKPKTKRKKLAVKEEREEEPEEQENLEEEPEEEIEKTEEPEEEISGKRELKEEKNNDDDDSFLSAGSFSSDAEGQLTIDVFQTPDEIIIQSTVAGVSPEDLNIDITSESVSIKGKRERREKIKDDDFFYQECYWGKFSRSVILPQEIDPDKSVAELKEGVLTIHLPKINRDRAKRVKIKLT